MHPKVVQDIPGHSEISMTRDIYSYVLPTMQEEAMAKLDQAFREGLERWRDVDSSGQS